MPVLKVSGALDVQGEEVGTGLLTYPALMAADILLYQVRNCSAQGGPLNEA